MQDENSKNTYQNPYAKSQEFRKKLTLPLPQIIELDEKFNIVFCCLLAKHIIDTNSLKELRLVLNAVAEYVIDPEIDYFHTKSAGFFEIGNKKIFFRERQNSILIGFLSETEYIARFAEYQYYSLQELITATVDKLIEDVEDF